MNLDGFRFKNKPMEATLTPAEGPLAEKVPGSVPPWQLREVPASALQRAIPSLQGSLCTSINP